MGNFKRWVIIPYHPSPQLFFLKDDGTRWHEDAGLWEPLSSVCIRFVKVYQVAQSLAIQVEDTRNKREVRAVNARNATCRVRSLETSDWHNLTHTHTHTLSVTTTQIHKHKDRTKVCAFSSLFFFVPSNTSSGVVLTTKKTTKNQEALMYHAALEIKTETMTHMHSRKGYTTLGKVNWVGQLHCFVPFLPLTNPFSSSSFVFLPHHHSLVFLFLSHSFPFFPPAPPGLAEIHTRGQKHLTPLNLL